MFIRKKKNKSGSTSIQIVSKDRGRYKVEIEKLELIGKQEIEKLSGLENKLFGFEKDEAVE